jgi:hypothetical protein
MRHYIITISAAIAAMLWLPSCRKPVAEEIVSPDITGEWKLESAESLGENAVVKASETIEVSVYVAFEEDGTFELYQRLDERRFKRYEGTWTLEGKILSGLYDGKKSTPWASPYSVSIEDGGKTLVMSCMSGNQAGHQEPPGQQHESSRYVRTSIPESVREEAY